MTPHELIMSRVRHLQMMRETGHVRRAHTLVHIGEYKNSEHQWQVATILLCLHPDPSLNLIKAALWHDTSEKWVGDTPGHAKIFLSEELGRLLGKIEGDIRSSIGAEFDLTEDERSWLRCADIIEFWLWCHDQMNMGNGHVKNVMKNVTDWLDKNKKLVPSELRAFVAWYKWHRTSERKIHNKPEAQT